MDDLGVPLFLETSIYSILLDQIFVMMLVMVMMLILMSMSMLHPNIGIGDMLVQFMPDMGRSSVSSHTSMRASLWLLGREVSCGPDPSSLSAALPRPLAVFLQ